MRRCPRCYTDNPDTATHCTCGFDFVAAMKRLEGARKGPFSLKSQYRADGLYACLYGVLVVAVGLAFTGVSYLLSSTFGFSTYIVAGGAVLVGTGLCIKRLWLLLRSAWAPAHV
jgi:hypothetical protein